MTTATVDVDRLKSGVDLRDLAGRLVTLRKESAAEFSGPCPKCGGNDRFHVKADAAFCRQCWPLETRTPAHDAIGFVQWIGLAHDFRGACEYLNGGGLLPSGPVARRAPEPKQAAGRWQDPQWQREARAILDTARACLASPAGDPGAEYLLSRGILPETWQAWGLGYDPAKWDPATKRKRPAVVIPWQGDKVTAVKYRFTDSTGKGDRFTQKGGGQQIAFGFNLAGAHWSTLWLLEGELNALSLWQALRAEYVVNCDVASFGSDSATADLDDRIRKWAGRYRQVIVWADDPDKALAAMRALPGTFGLFGVRSPLLVPGDKTSKLDANAMLGQPGALARFAFAAWDSFDKDLEYIGRLQAELERLPGLASDAG